MKIVAIVSLIILVISFACITLASLIEAFFDFARAVKEWLQNTF